MYQTLTLILVLLTPSRAYAEEVPPGVEEGIVVCIDDRRTLSNIVWSCLATVFACTWLAVHPNVPGRKIMDSAIPFAIERMKIMAIAILAPEVIVAWAAEQFIVARKARQCDGVGVGVVLRRRTRNQEVASPYRNLTMTHGFFLSMGGFYYTQQRKLVDLETIQSQPYLVGDIAAISAERIKDKSKGDALSKTVSVLQISWFIAQCIARAAQDLPITLIEMTALAFSGLSIITYCLWWHKPLNVMYHISLDGLDEREYMQNRQTRHLNDRTPPTAKSRRISMRMVTDGLHWFLGGIVAVVSGEPTDEGGHTNIDSGGFRFSSGTDNSVATLRNHSQYRIVIRGIALHCLVILLSIACRNGAMAVFMFGGLGRTLHSKHNRCLCSDEELGTSEVAVERATTASGFTIRLWCAADLLGIRFVLYLSCWCSHIGLRVSFMRKSSWCLSFLSQKLQSSSPNR
ncbi:hypothetical protein EV421DRAFT_1952695 [Armillaria borealis]|uniref:Uncharacterized protein n=1 Tax=Armillaria borealis TaxID=47425 RepID=A0AA39JFS3_9AGAR|nr:hypothetical protein EV421DRAFT_1952695 [Armillaria borealis]